MKIRPSASFKQRGIMEEYRDCEFEELVGKTLKRIELEGDKAKRSECLNFIIDDNQKYIMFHRPLCCEEVIIEDICGEFDWLINTPILKAEKRSNHPNDYSTWTFYEIATINGSVTIRWYGTSNGYYSEEVDFAKVTIIKELEQVKTK